MATAAEKKQDLKDLWTFQLLPQLPFVPDYLLKTIDFDQRPQEDDFEKRKQEFLKIKKKSDWNEQAYECIRPMTSNNNVRYQFNDEFIDWIKKNICQDFQYKNSGIMFFDEIQLPHTDLTRDYVLLYNIQTGGEDARLCFWQESGEDLIRPRMTTVDRSARLKLVSEVAGPSNCWYLMNTSVLHSVENTNSVRVNLQISFNREIPPNIKNLLQ